MAVWWRVALAALTVACAPAWADEPKPTVLWFRPDYAPHSIISGPDQDKGTADLRAQAFWRRMPEFDHQWVTAAIPRILDQLGALPNACTPIFIRTPEREAVALFSEPVAKLLPNGLITTRARLERFQPYRRNDGAVRLDEALAGSKLRVATRRSRAYGVGIDDALKRHAGTPAIIETTQSDALVSSLRKLANQDEFDGVIGYASELHYLARNHGLEGLIYLAIAEAPALGQSHFACSKSERGAAVVARVNELLRDPEVRREIVESYRAWLPADAAELYDRLLTQ